MKPIPHIPAVNGSAERPLWSVMIPAFRPDRRYLTETLESILQQAPGPDQMQIAIVDDHSGDDIARQVAETANGRVEFHCQAANTGMAGNWNHAIALARGHWVHLLHQDDLVLPGFYRKLQPAITGQPDLGAAYTQHYMIDGQGRRKGLMSLNSSRHPGIVSDWLRYVFVHLSIQTPSIVVKRAVYEQLGGFREDFRYALDWDMWKRIAPRYPLWFEPEPLACYRRHASGASMGFFLSGENMLEVRKSIELSRTYLPPEQGASMVSAANARYRQDAVDSAISALFTLRNPAMARRQFEQAKLFGGAAWFPLLVARRFSAAVGRWMRNDWPGLPKAG